MWVTNPSTKKRIRQGWGHPAALHKPIFVVNECLSTLLEKKAPPFDRSYCETTAVACCCDEADAAATELLLLRAAGSTLRRDAAMRRPFEC